MSKLKMYRVIKSYTVWEYTDIQAISADEAWNLAEDEMDEIEWQEYSDGSADEEIVEVKEIT